MRLARTTSAMSTPNGGVNPEGLMPDVHVIPGVWSPIRGYSELVHRLETFCVSG
jgi:hypothetical protein